MVQSSVSQRQTRGVALQAVGCEQTKIILFSGTVLRSALGEQAQSRQGQAVLLLTGGFPRANRRDTLQARF